MEWQKQMSNATPIIFNTAPRRRRVGAMSKKRARSRSEPLPEDLIDEEHRKEILETFDTALEKGKKTLSIKDAKVSLITLGINTKSDEIRTYLNNHRRESEDRETLDQSRFLNFAAQKLIQAEKAHKAFGLIDKDKKGVVVLEDLQRVAQELGGEDAELTQDELQEMIDLVDKSGNGFLSTKDFERIARKVNL